MMETNRQIDDLIDEQILFRDANYMEMSLEERDYIVDNIRWLMGRKALEASNE